MKDEERHASNRGRLFGECLGFSPKCSVLGAHLRTEKGYRKPRKKRRAVAAKIEPSSFGHCSSHGSKSSNRLRAARRTQQPGDW
ncbi:hypothetical protein KFK09_027876 [Dendrobium nobile]|uniref:Uncharacterized protein n=1 Tax=Dendrobium nobile TaxID=94219 RepID=A0A8T3A1W6_DENNO|nr:hypothetical protein KFK09_027876 [Dendrobium nobile]